MFDEYLQSIICSYVPFSMWTKVILIFGRHHIMPFHTIDRLDEVTNEMLSRIPMSTLVKNDKMTSSIWEMMEKGYVTDHPMISEMNVLPIIANPDKYSYAMHKCVLPFILHHDEVTVDYLVRYHLSAIFDDPDKYGHYITRIIIAYPYSDIILENAMKLGVRNATALMMMARTGNVSMELCSPFDIIDCANDVGYELTDDLISACQQYGRLNRYPERQPKKFIEDDVY